MGTESHFAMTFCLNFSFKFQLEIFKDLMNSQYSMFNMQCISCICAVLPVNGKLARVDLGEKTQSFAPVDFPKKSFLQYQWVLPMEVP